MIFDSTLANLYHCFCTAQDSLMPNLAVGEEATRVHFKGLQPETPNREAIRTKVGPEETTPARLAVSKHRGPPLVDREGQVSSRPEPS